MPVSLRHIRYFIAAADAGQVSQAAMELNVSQSAVTAGIKELERRLDILLFERHPRGVTLTYEGHQFLQYARNVAATVEEAMRVPRMSRKQTVGEVRVACTYTVAGYFLPAYLRRFAQSFPRVQVQLFEAPRPEIEKGLINGIYDLAVMLTSNLADKKAVEHETLMRSQRRLWLGIDHPLLSEASVGLEQVAREPYVMLSVDEAAQTAFGYWKATPHRPNVTFETSSVEAVRSMVGMSMGITILSDMVYRPWSLEGRRIEVRELSDPVPSMDVGLAWCRGREPSMAASAFMDSLRLRIRTALD